MRTDHITILLSLLRIAQRIVSALVRAGEIRGGSISIGR
jgi:hypothetical protein